MDPDKDEVTTKEVEDCTPAKERVHQALIDIIQKGKGYNLEFEIHPKNSEQTKIISCIAHLKKDKNGNALKVTGVIQDITKQKKAERALIESEKRFKNLSELTFEGIIFHSNSITIDCNDSLINLFGYSRDEIIGENVIKLIYPDDQPIAVQNIQKKVADPYEIRGVKKDGTIFQIEIEARNVNIDDKQIRVAAIRDISERKKTQDQLKQNNIRLHDLNATKDKFFSIIAHDLRGPMNNLVGFSDLLERNHLAYDKEKLSHIINLMSTSAKKTFALLENLLIWSRSQRDKISFNPQTFICKELVSEILQEMEHLAFAKGISFETDKEDKGHPVFVDKDMFKTVYRNLISNAIKYTNEGGTISIGCGKEDEKFVKFFVKDNGVGIPKKNINKLFKLDENITTEGTHKEHGTGLGLTLCKDFVEKHGGHIWVESIENKGSTFWFTFPKPD